MANNLSNSNGSSNKKNVSKAAEFGKEVVEEFGKGFGRELGKGVANLGKTKIEANSKERMQKADLEAKKEIELIKNMDKEERIEYTKSQERIKKEEAKASCKKCGMVCCTVGLVAGLGVWVIKKLKK